MLQDRYGNALSTQSTAACAAYVEGVDLLISANHGAEDAFRRAIAADADFALGHVGLARTLQISARGAEASEAMASAIRVAPRASQREQSHVAALEPLIQGNGPTAYTRILSHLAEFPRDAMVVQPCTGVFGLIGFSGQPGREAEQLAFLHRLAPHYGDDWWFGSVLAFAQIEAGQTNTAVETIERSLAQQPRNANGAHIRAHVYYERGEADAGFSYIDKWREDYDKRAALHCHVSWHVALWALELGSEDRAWEVIEADVLPGAAWGPPINVLTDSASFLLRSELAGAKRRHELWRKVSAFAAEMFPKPGVAFADLHAALAHAMADNSDALDKVISDATGPAGDLVAAFGDGFRAFAREDWLQVIATFSPVMSTHERLGGSRAQRDLIEFALVGAYLKSGQSEEARRLLARRRPTKAHAHPVAGL